MALSPIVKPLLDQVASLCLLSAEDTADLHRIAEAAQVKSRADVLGLCVYLLKARRFTVLAWGRQSIGKTHAFRELAESLRAPLWYLDADADPVFSRGFVPRCVQAAPLTDASPSDDDVIRHVLAQADRLQGEIALGVKAGQRGETSGMLLDTVTGWSSAVWSDFALIEKAALAAGKGKAAMGANRASGSTANLIKTATLRIFHAADGDPLSATPQAPGPYVLGAVAHAKALPRTNADGDAIMGSFDRWSLQLGGATGSAAKQVVDFALGFGIRQSPTDRAVKREFVYLDSDHTECKSRLGDETERAIAAKCAKTADLKGLVWGLFHHRVSLALAHLRERFPPVAS